MGTAFKVPVGTVAVKGRSLEPSGLFLERADWLNRAIEGKQALIIEASKNYIVTQKELQCFYVEGKTFQSRSTEAT